MRYYLICNEEEIKIDLIKSHKVLSYMWKFQFDYNALEPKNKSLNVYVRKLAGKYFYSNDGISWNRIVKQNLPDQLLYVDKIFKLNRGYRPSGSLSSDEGALFTKMPGKVVKIFIKVGDEVIKGQTLIILESMKMENEIKSNVEGKVKYIHIKEGQALEQGVLLLEVEN